MRQTAENYLASGIPEVEVPQAVLDPEGRHPETGIDVETLQATIAGVFGTGA